MSNATSAHTIRPKTIRESEAAHFGKLAADWWNPKGSSAMLHKLNPVRLGFIRDAIDAHFGSDSRGVKPLAGRKALDVGCGAGLLCEPLARLGAVVSGVDAAEENIAAARLHAEGSGLSIDYRCGDVGQLGLAGFDLVTSMEVIEHVADKPAFIAALEAALAPGGLMILSTPNRTTRSRLLLVEGAEGLGMVPKGTHHWDDFITPVELHDLLVAAGLKMGNPMGIAWSVSRGLHLSDDLALNYIVTVTRED
ncbi:MAG: bifunctional 3-demethylubiquinol 3-O-methyltransferase/2-polyprenyl-6-hydroxyphenol methylase [Novosphingobium sp. 17-62-19]|uniref:bifunctional 2-polyprenyl-6-hydroxyphenol methylase/3-demethylubiquinol 3-O-methyltransferase UbiG n=1 Tax=Novosphingobium sp. 17-62-19 TaxID=1970406 RepID=UPI000BD06D05|nr:bifunctional 2-polyprenyl-6-hydroxyphenol methylase/3-demethylubiquinol 3-O-methyltransferase UbiG [Novosphingobium sp. 17-62-19]OYX95164.1 MAG: bifunctional 3-demethylubiquinol 3-O-methyltransferase/2-polyprenyl-6-hydroxyphenol methylase [Novosphingobium sp. 35-62-5]OZA18959.1 MAG: bifunctional 3-demethylubiquinol 3-O-methyltransferase/2-polyprenyl-6-hydroxyphenol methylase [Novosphingobium sp. 17-62-19]HQS94978.1 bifunctional 2-polyprenyl-6-hydroxyphenol methylase/3-demethylubiquinol 3-O-me